MHVGVVELDPACAVRRRQAVGLVEPPPQLAELHQGDGILADILSVHLADVAACPVEIGLAICLISRTEPQGGPLAICLREAREQVSCFRYVSDSVEDFGLDLGDDWNRGAVAALTLREGQSVFESPCVCLLYTS